MNESMELETVVCSALEAQVKAEIDISIATARRYPRSLTAFRQKATTMATSDPDIAGSCFYKLSRKGDEGSKSIEGPSVRFAEIVAAAYGNLRFGARVIEVQENVVIAQGVAHDLENNVSTTTEVRRRIVNKYGKRYSEDMINTTCNAACSIALRNAIFKTVPLALAKPIYDQAKKAAIGDVKTIGERRTAMLKKFSELGVIAARIFAKLDIKGSDDIGLEHLENLIGFYTAIKDGEETVESVFPEQASIPVTESTPPKTIGESVTKSTPEVKK